MSKPLLVTPAEAGVSAPLAVLVRHEIPAFAGMTAI
jgi:hypothetical protein